LGCRDTETLIETEQEGFKDTVRFPNCAGASQTEFRHQPILEGAIGPLHPPLRFRAAGEQLRYAELTHGAAELGWLAAIDQESLNSLIRGSRATEHDVAVAVKGQRYAAPLDDAHHQAEIALGILLFLKEGVGDLAGGIVHGEKQCKPRPSLLQSAVVAAVYLHQHSFLWHALAPVAMAWTSSVPWAG